jgi:hypothetical protein
MREAVEEHIRRHRRIRAPQRRIHSPLVPR